MAAVWRQCFDNDIAELYYQYKMTNTDGQWIITQIIPFKPASEYTVLKDF